MIRETSSVGISEGFRWKGRIQIICTYRDGHIEIEALENLITNAGMNLLKNALLGLSSDSIIRYVAIGTNNTAPSVADVTLNTEIFRKAITALTDGGTGIAVSTCYIAPLEANVAIRELGWFASPTATATPGSGIMIARVLWSHTKTDLESIQIVRTDTIG